MSFFGDCLASCGGFLCGTAFETTQVKVLDYSMTFRNSNSIRRVLSKKFCDPCICSAKTPLESPDLQKHQSVFAFKTRPLLYVPSPTVTPDPALLLVTACSTSCQHCTDQRCFIVFIYRNCCLWFLHLCLLSKEELFWVIWQMKNLL